MNSSTTVIFVPGAWHPASVLSPLAELVQQAGYKTDLVDHPSVGPTKPQDNFDADVAVISEHISKALVGGQKVVMVAHSYGGIPTCEAAKNFPGQIAHLVFMASFIIAQDSSLFATVGGQDPAWWMVSEDRTVVTPKDPEAVFYNALCPEAARKASTCLKPQNYQVMHSSLTYAAWKHIPATYLYCSRDVAIPLVVQKMMVEKTAQGTPIRTEEIDAGHSPYLSQPRETADAIKRAIMAS